MSRSEYDANGHLAARHVPKYPPLDIPTKRQRRTEKVADWVLACGIALALAALPVYFK